MSTLSVNKITDLTDFTFPSTTTISVTGVNASGASIFGSANITSNLSVTGTANVGNLSVTGSANITSNLSVTGTANVGNLSVTGTANVGNLSITSTGGRITGDFSNATLASRVMFQSSTTNAVTAISAIPNGTGTVSTVNLYNANSFTNYAYAQLQINASETRVLTGAAGSGTALPLTFYTQEVERFRIGTSGQLGIGGATYGTSGQVLTSGGASAAPTWSTPAAASGTVTSITAGTGLSGGTITTSGTIALVTTLGAVGTYALLRSSSSVTAGSTYAGSGLQYTGSRLINNGCAGVAFLPQQSATASPSGTWQAMGTVVTDPAGSYAGTLFIRTA